MTTTAAPQDAEPGLPNIVRLDLEALEAHPANRDVQDDELHDLTESMKSPIGLLQFPVVVSLPDGGHRIIVGHSRIKSARKLGWKRIPCIVRDDLSSADELIALLGDNDRHRHFTPSQRARIDAELALLPDFKTPKAIAEATQRTAPEVAGSLALHRLGKRAHGAADSGQLTLDDAIALDKLGKLHPNAVDRVLQKASKGYDLHYAIAEAEWNHKRADVIATTTQDLLAKGIAVIKPPKGFPHASKVAPLDQLKTNDGQSLVADELCNQPGFGAVVDTNQVLAPQITYVCLDPDSFGYRRIDGSYTSPEDRRAKAERAARDALHREQLAIAAMARLKWLRQALASQAKAKPWLDDALCQYVIGGEDFYPDDTADALCAPPSGDKVTAKRATHRFVAVIIGGLHDLACDPVIPRTARDVAQLYDLLSAHGYELTEVEQAERATCERHLTSDRGDASTAGHELDHDDIPDTVPAGHLSTEDPAGVMDQ